jgi:hypothetical protein
MVVVEDVCELKLCAPRFWPSLFSGLSHDLPNDESFCAAFLDGQSLIVHDGVTSLQQRGIFESISSFGDAQNQSVVAFLSARMQV